MLRKKHKNNEKVFYPCPNISSDPENYFEIDQEEWIMASEIGEIIALVHSHPNGLPYLSTADRMCQTRCATAFWLVVDNEILQFRPAPALLGRNFINYHQDCSQLVLDAYMLAGLDFGRPKPPAGYDFEWFESGQNLIEENLVRLGFEKLTEEPAQLGGRGGGGVGQVDDAGAHLGHLGLQLRPFGSALPVVALEEDVEGLQAPREALVLVEVHHDGVDEAQGGDQVAALFEGDDGSPSFHADERLVGGDSDHQAGAAPPEPGARPAVPRGSSTILVSFSFEFGAWHRIVLCRFRG